jgi:release factor glutamine methyltransferase
MDLKSILEVLTTGSAFLERKGVESPRLNMEHLLAHALGLKRMDLYRQFDRPLSEGELAPLREWTARRGAGVPLQHLLGTVDFHRYSFRCDARALIPRPETEELVEKIIDRRKSSPPRRILDMGCGSGVIGLSLAAAFPESQVVLADVSADALALARENASWISDQWAAEQSLPACVPLGSTGVEVSPAKVAESDAAATRPASGVSPAMGLLPSARDFMQRIQWMHSDMWEAFENAAASDTFDVLAANLPYIPAAEVATLGREVLRDPLAALDGGQSGLELIERFLALAPRYGAPGALLALEHGPDQGEAVCALLAQAGCTSIALERDMSRRERFSFGVFGGGQPSA